jgi:hypothetical protein
MKLIETMPAFSVELKRLLLAANESMLASKIDGLSLVEKCRCQDDFCASFYTAPKPRGITAEIIAASRLNRIADISCLML